jgi:hypothetical protein
MRPNTKLMGARHANASGREEAVIGNAGAESKKSSRQQRAQATSVEGPRLGCEAATLTGFEPVLPP